MPWMTSKEAEDRTAYNQGQITYRARRGAIKRRKRSGRFEYLIPDEWLILDDPVSLPSIPPPVIIEESKIAIRMPAALLAVVVLLLLAAWFAAWGWFV